MALNILLTASNTSSLSDTEQAFSDWRGGLGDTVTPLSHSADVPDLTGVDLVVLGDTQQANLAGKWDNVDIPLLSLSLSAPIHTEVEDRGFPSVGDARLTRFVEATAATAETTGSVTVYDSTPPTGYQYYPEGSLGPEVVIMARHEASGSRVTGVIIPQGAELHNEAVCPSKRATLPFNHFAIASDDGLALAAEIIAWLAPQTPPTVPVVVNTTVTQTVLIDATGSTGYEPLTFDFTQVSGPTVTITNHGDGTASFKVPDPWETDVVVSVTVTGADTNQDSENVVVPAPEGGGGDPSPSVVQQLVFTAEGWR